MEKIEQIIDDRLFRQAMGSFASGVTVITTKSNGDVHGMTANAFMSISLQPKLIAISVDHRAKMLEPIREAKKFAVNILSDQQKEMSMYFAGQLKEKRAISFEELQGVPVLPKSATSIACQLYDEHEAGDHTIFIGEVLGITLEEEAPLVFHGGQYKEIVPSAD